MSHWILIILFFCRGNYTGSIMVDFQSKKSCMDAACRMNAIKTIGSACVDVTEKAKEIEIIQCPGEKWYAGMEGCTK